MKNKLAQKTIEQLTFCQTKHADFYESFQHKFKEKEPSDFLVQKVIDMKIVTTDQPCPTQSTYLLSLLRGSSLHLFVFLLLFLFPVVTTEEILLGRHQIPGQVDHTFALGAQADLVTLVKVQIQRDLRGLLAQRAQQIRAFLRGQHNLYVRIATFGQIQRRLGQMERLLNRLRVLFVGLQHESYRNQNKGNKKRAHKLTHDGMLACLLSENSHLV